MPSKSASAGVVPAERKKRISFPISWSSRRKKEGKEEADSLALSESLERVADLGVSYISYSHSGDTSTGLTVTLGPPSSTLRHLDLSRLASGRSGSKLFEGPVVAALVRVVGRCPALERLGLAGNGLRDRALQQIVDSLASGAASRLQELDLSHNKLCDGNLLARLLADTSGHLLVLNLAANELNDLATIALCAGLSMCASLRRLSLAGVRVGDAGATALAEALRRQREVLQAESCKAAPAKLAPLAALAEMLGMPRRPSVGSMETSGHGLQELDLSQTLVGDSGARALAESLFDAEGVAPPVLRWLDLAGARVGAPGRAALEAAVQASHTRVERFAEAMREALLSPDHCPAESERGCMPRPLSVQGLGLEAVEAEFSARISAWAGANDLQRLLAGSPAGAAVPWPGPPRSPKAGVQAPAEDAETVASGAGRSCSELAEESDEEELVTEFVRQKTLVQEEDELGEERLVSMFKRQETAREVAEVSNLRRVSVQLCRLAATRGPQHSDSSDAGEDTDSGFSSGSEIWSTTAGDEARAAVLDQIESREEKEGQAGHEELALTPSTVASPLPSSLRSSLTRRRRRSRLATMPALLGVTGGGSDEEPTGEDLEGVQAPCSQSPDSSPTVSTPSSCQVPTAAQPEGCPPPLPGNDTGNSNEGGNCKDPGAACEGKATEPATKDKGKGKGKMGPPPPKGKGKGAPPASAAGSAAEATEPATKGKGKGKGKMGPPPAKGKGKGAPPASAAGPAAKALCKPGEAPFRRKIFWKQLDLADAEGTIFGAPGAAAPGAAGPSSEQAEDAAEAATLGSAVAMARQQTRKRIDTEALQRMFEGPRARGSESSEARVKLLRRLQSRTEGVKVLSDNRARNVAIVLRRLAVSPDRLAEIMRGLYWEAEELPTDQLEKVLEVIPTPEEASGLREHESAEAIAQLRDVERMMLPLVGVRRASARVQLLCCARGTQAQFEMAQGHLALLREACNAIRSSGLLREVFLVALELGNYINYGADDSKGARAMAISIGSLLQFRDFKVTGSADSLHFLCATLSHADPSLDAATLLREELRPVARASEIQVQGLSQIVRVIERDVAMIKGEIEAAACDYDDCEEATGSTEDGSQVPEEAGKATEEPAASQLVLRLRGSPRLRLRSLRQALEHAAGALAEDLEETSAQARELLRFCGVVLPASREALQDLGPFLAQLAEFLQVFAGHWAEVQSDLPRYRRLFSGYEEAVDEELQAAHPPSPTRGALAGRPRRKTAPAPGRMRSTLKGPSRSFDSVEREVHPRDVPAESELAIEAL